MVRINKFKSVKIYEKYVSYYVSYYVLKYVSYYFYITARKKIVFLILKTGSTPVILTGVNCVKTVTFSINFFDLKNNSNFSIQIFWE